MPTGSNNQCSIGLGFWDGQNVDSLDSRNLRYENDEARGRRSSANNWKLESMFLEVPMQVATKML